MSAGGSPPSGGVSGPAATASGAGTTDWRLLLREAAVDLNDGVVSAAGVVEGFASAGASTQALLLAGLAVMVVGGFSAAGAKYGEERTFWEHEHAMIEQERRAIEADPEGELAELAAIYEAHGLRPELAAEVARELMRHDPVAAHAHAELYLGDTPATSGALQAAAVSGVAYAAGALVPLLLMQALPASDRIPMTFVIVLIGLAATGWFTAWLTGLPVWRLVRRNVVFGTAAMLLSLAVGSVVDL